MALVYSSVFLLAALAGLASGESAKREPSRAVGKLPALGWNSWNAYACNINETKVLAAANSFVTLGLKDAGYQYVNIDDCWPLMTRNSSTQRIVPDPSKFPNGISGVAKQIHALGLKMGIYGDAGTATCAGFPGSLGFETIDSQTFGEWGIDYLKYDNCNVPGNWSDSGNYDDWYNSNSATRYKRMGDALATLANPVQYSLCIWGTANVWDWGARVGHSWRMTGDASAAWSFITYAINNNVQHLDSIGFYGHNDMDMMEIGNGQLTIQEERTHFAGWAFLKSPILLGTDLSKLNSDQLAIIKNAELLAFSQDNTVSGPARPFTPYSSAPSTTPPEYYSGNSTKGTHVFIINTSNSTASKHFTLSNIPGVKASSSYKFHDMWAQSDLSGTYKGSDVFNVSVQAHDTVAYLLTSA